MASVSCPILGGGLPVSLPAPDRVSNVPLVLPCSNCNQKIGIPDELKGKQIRCPKCRECFVVERRQAEQPQAAAVAAAPAAQSPAGPQAAAASQPAVFQCPSCSQKMRLPTTTAVSKFKCPGCATVFNRGQHEGGGAVAAPSPRPLSPRPVAPHPVAPRPAAPQPVASRPAAARAVPPRPVAQRSARPNRAAAATSGVARGRQAGSASSNGDSLFSDLPPLPAQTQAAQRGPAPAFVGASALAAPARGTSFGGGGAAGRRSDSSKLGPSLLIGISYFLALLVGLFILIAVLRNDGGRSSARDTTVLVVLFGLAAAHYVAMIAGAVGMLMHAPRWLSITTCILGMLPTIFVSTLCFGALLYPFALAGCIWGLVSLLGGTRRQVGYAGAGAGTQAGHNFGGATAASNDYMRQASREIAGKAASDQSAISTGKAILCIVGGIGCLGFAAFAAYSYYQYMNGEAEVRRPGRALSGAVIAAITGIGLLTQGIAGFTKRSS